jgi:hypothetical protein
MIQALKRTKPSVDKTQLTEYEEFTKTFGQEGWNKILNSFLILKFIHWFQLQDFE